MKVLIADDDPVTLDALRECLTVEGYQPVPATNGAESIKLWKEQHPALICLDVMMPGVDGYEVCRRVRAIDSHTPILFISAKNEEIDIVVGLELGGDDFIRKPFGRRELLARIRAVLRRASARAAKPRVLQMHDLTVYPDELRAVRDGREIELSPREVAILSLLYERVGMPVDRNTFLDRCWGLEYYPNSRTLDQHIVTLRKQVERDPANPLIIETVRGVGYRFRTAS